MAPPKKQIVNEVKEEINAPRLSLKEIANRCQKSSGSMGEKEDKFFNFNFPSINQLDL